MDRIDKHILRLLQQDARQATAEIADKVGLSASPCARRIKRLEEQGIIANYRDQFYEQLIEQLPPRHSKRLKTEAKRRQLQYVGRIMRDLLPDEDIHLIEAQLQDLQGLSAQAQHQLQQVEQWRHELLEDNATLTRFINAYPQVERQQLRQLVKQARQHADKPGPQQKSTARALFRFVRDTLRAHA